MKLEGRRQKVAELIEGLTSDDSFKHVLEVAEDCINLSELSFESAICKDVLSYREWSVDDIYYVLQPLGYSEAEAEVIISNVIELTQHYTKEAYSELNRSDRMHLENIRMSNTPMEVQSIECANMYRRCLILSKREDKFKEAYHKECYVRMIMMDKVERRLFLRLAAYLYKNS